MIGQDDVKRLSLLSDQMPVFLSVYLDRGDVGYERFLTQRDRTIKKALAGNKELLDNHDASMEDIRAWLEKGAPKGTRGYAVFASKVKGMFEVHQLDVPVENMLVLDTSPYVKPLAELVEEFEPFVVVLIDEGNARILSLQMGVHDVEKTLHESIMNKHRMGGCSQRRFQRLREGRLDHFYKEVAEELAKVVEMDGSRRIVLAGPGTAKSDFLKRLEKSHAEKVIGSFDISYEKGDGLLIDTALELFFEREREEEAELVSRIRASILGQGLAVYGLSEVLEAVISGRGNVVAVLKGKDHPGSKCEGCGVTFPKKIDTCPHCGERTGQVDVIEEIIEAASQMDTTVEFVDDSDFLSELGGIAALLRF